MQRLKLECSVLNKKINMYWYTFSSAHAMPSELNNRFMNVDVHSTFTHYRVNQNSEFDDSRTSVQLTIHVQESIENVLSNAPSISPSQLLTELKNQYPSYSSTYWIKAEKSIKSYRKTLLKKFIDKTCAITPNLFMPSSVGHLTIPTM